MKFDPRAARVTVGVFVLSSLSLLSIAFFLIGDRHKAFSRHIDYYTEMRNVNGVAPGSKVRVSGFEAGQVASMQAPDRPSGRFRIKLRLDDKLHNLVRTDSVVTVETDGLVGDKFLLIRGGSDTSMDAADGTTLPSKEPVELSAVIEKVSGTIDQANATIADVRGKLDAALEAVTNTVDNANGIVTGVRQGKGTVGMLLTDQQTAAAVKQSVTNAQQASSNLNQVTVQARQVMTDFQSRDLFSKAEDTLNNAKQASAQLAQSSQHLNTTLTEAFSPDRTGTDAGENIRESLSNINLTTANLNDDTEALKHNFFFRGFFKKRGFYSLTELTPAEYRTNKFFQGPDAHRSWLDAQAFELDASGREVLSPAGAQQIDQIVGGEKDSVVDEPIVVEGYSTASPASSQIATSRSRSLLVTAYLERRFQLRPQNIGAMTLNATPPPPSGKSSWDGAAIVVLKK